MQCKWTPPGFLAGIIQYYDVRITHKGKTVYEGATNTNNISLQGDLKSDMVYFVTVTPVTHRIGTPMTTKIVFSNVGENAH